ncbi:MAG: protein kinase family protein [Candidatus Hydrogenedentes bacterium]|nr:protein kinase family protein [Candidatus Hydrogenedentota bacterium]
MKELGSGAQGRVSLVLDKTKTRRAEACYTLQSSIPYIGGIATDEARRGHAQNIVNSILDLIAAEKQDYQGALKELHKPTEGPVDQKEIARIHNEIALMKTVAHSNLLPILDANPDEFWFVSKYFASSTLHSNLSNYKGSISKSLKAFRGLVDGVRYLHEKGIVHRDIKPKNIFVAENGDLVLGDFGIAFFQDDQRTRLTDTFDQAGSRDWMPAWALHGRVDDVKPNSDVYSLGKVLWSMLAGRERLVLWYILRDGNNLETLFPNDDNMRLINDLLRKCVVEDEENCIPSAIVLLEEVDKLLKMLALGGEILRDDLKRHCRVCGEGQYLLRANREQVKLSNFGLEVRGSNTYKFFVCNACGHVQLFFFEDGKSLPIW